MKSNTKPPIQYQRGWTEFYKLKFKLTPDVLIPRPETELLVDEVIKLNPKSVLDIGTGSGCIAISIAKNLKDAKVIAIDISKQALQIAEQNSKLNGTTKRIVFFQNDLLSGIKATTDVIVTNLPYIPTARLMHIDPMVSEFEPKIALDGGVDGFELYRRLFSQIKENKLYPKFLIAEIDDSHRDLSLAEARKYFPDAKEIEIKLDLAKIDRILKISF